MKNGFGREPGSMNEEDIQKISEFETNPSEARIYRPDSIEIDTANLQPKVGLFGTCGSPRSTWRQDIFIPKLESQKLQYFNPQVDNWTPDRAQLEAEHMATNQVIVLPISKETHGYASLGEAGWATLSALLRGQDVGIYLETDDTLPESAKRARMLFKSFGEQLQNDYPVFQFEDSIEDLATWAALTCRQKEQVKKSKIREKREVEFVRDTEARPCVSIFGTSTDMTATWKKEMVGRLESTGVPYFDPYKLDWNEQRDIPVETDHKNNDKVILQVITKDWESFGSIAESGLLALSAFVRGQAYGLYIEDHPSPPTSDTNRARQLIRAHVNKLNEQFPGLVYLANSPEELTEFAVKVMNQVK